MRNHALTDSSIDSEQELGAGSDTQIVDNITTLTHEIGEQINQYIFYLAQQFSCVNNPEFLAQAAELARKLPYELAVALRKHNNGEGYCVIRGIPVDDDVLGPTPPGWKFADTHRTAMWDILLVLVAHLLGTPFAWEGQQAGALVNNIVPSRENEYSQTGASSRTNLLLHTEDAFHPGRCHYLVLMCLRNFQGIGTTVSSVRKVDLSPAQWDALSYPMVPIFPDTSYVDNDINATDRSYAHGSDLAHYPPIATVWRNDDGHCLRFDPAYTPVECANDEWQEAYHQLVEQLTHKTCTAVLNPGDIIVINNDIAVHGRNSFAARYDGSDRWLKRINVHDPHTIRPENEKTESGYGEKVVDPYCVLSQYAP